MAALWAFCLFAESPGPHGGETAAERMARLRAQTAAYEARRQREVREDLQQRKGGTFLFLNRDENGEGAWNALSATATGEVDSKCRVGASGYDSKSHFLIRPSSDGETFEIVAKHRPRGTLALPTFGKPNPKGTEKTRWKIKPNFNGTFEVCDVDGNPLHGCRDWTIAKLEDVNETAFIKGAGDQHAIAPNDIQQGNLGSCTLWAAVHSVLEQRGPEEIEKLFSAGAVTFPGRRPVKTGNQFLFQWQPGRDSQPLGASFGDTDEKGRQESWPVLLEKAYTVWRRSLKTTDGGANAGEVLSLVTGEKVKFVALHHAFASAQSNKAFDCLADAYDAGHPIVCSSRSTVPEFNDSGLFSSHAYAMKKVIPGRQPGVILIDPHGREVELTKEEFFTNFAMAAHTTGKKNAWERTVDSASRGVGDAVDTVLR